MGEVIEMPGAAVAPVTQLQSWGGGFKRIFGDGNVVNAAACFHERSQRSLANFIWFCKFEAGFATGQRKADYTADRIRGERLQHLAAQHKLRLAEREAASLTQAVLTGFISELPRPGTVYLPHLTPIPLCISMWQPDGDGPRAA